jgi:small GTP-binding protein
MPMPHRIQMQLIKRRLVGKEGAARVKELRAVLADLPDYKNGPYADIRKWVLAEMAATRGRARVLNRDSVSVRKEGAAQIALVGPPNAGKSSLLQALSNVQIKTGDYAFTTTRPVPALTRLNGVLVQLVEIPGLIEGAHEDRGGGRALLGVARSADVLVACHDLAAPLAALEALLAELEAAEIERPRLLVATKADEAPPGAVVRLASAWGAGPLVAVSVLDDGALGALRQALWELLGLRRVFLRQGEHVEQDPRAFHPPVLVLDVADAIHHELAERCTGARVWGASARFPGQRVGRRHELADGDTVEILA